MAIASENVKLLQTACFHEALNEVWLDKLSATNSQLLKFGSRIFSLITLGFLAPVVMSYRDDNKESKSVCRIKRFFLMMSYGSF